MIFSADTWQVTLFSIAVGLASTLLILPFGITLAWLFARKEWPLKSLFETIVLLPLVMYDDLVGTFTKAGYVDEQSQKNDLAIVAQVAEVAEVVSPRRAYDFSFARAAEQQLTKQSWKP